MRKNEPHGTFDKLNGMENFVTYLHTLPKTPLTEAVKALYEAEQEPVVFKTLDDMRNYLDSAAYNLFENSEYDQYEQVPYGNLEDVQEVDMPTFVKEMGDMNHDVNALVGKPIDGQTMDSLIYDWYLCLHTNCVFGWTYVWDN